MQKRLSLLAGTLCACGWLVLTSCGEAPMQPAADNEAPGKDQAESQAVLRRMADYLGQLPAFACRVNSTMHIQANGMDNRMETKQVVRLERPNRVAVIVEEGMMGMTIVSDGQQLYQSIPMLKRYTVQEAPADLSELKKATDGMGASMMGMSASMIPTSGDELYDALMEGVTRSEYLGKEMVNDTECHHCRFEQQQFNWEIWIEAGDRPLPQKIVPDLSKQFAEAGGRLEDAKIEFTVVFSNWDVAPTFTDEDFKFQPPAGAEKVDSLFGGLAGGQDEGPHPLLGEAAPKFETVDAEGEPIDLANHLGKDVVVLDFWATWCGPCVEAMPEIAAIAKKYADRGVVVYAVNAGEEPAAIHEFLSENKLDLPVALDIDGTISGLYKVEGIPQTVLIGKDGRVQAVHVGFSSQLDKLLTKNIEDLLAGKDLAGAAPAGEDEDEAP